MRAAAGGRVRRRVRGGAGGFDLQAWYLRAWYLGACYLLALSHLGAAWRMQAQDFQSWNEVDVAAAWRRVDLLVPLVARTDPSLPNPQLAAMGLTADVHLPAGLTLTPGYLFADLPQAGYLVHIPLLALTGTVRAGRLTVADRNRFEGLLGYPEDPVRYRNRLLMDVVFGRGRKVHAFLDDEVFFNLSAGDFNQNRLQAGGGYHFSPRYLLDVYYLQKNPAAGAATRVLGTTLRVTMTRRTARLTPTHSP